MKRKYGIIALILLIIFSVGVYFLFFGRSQSHKESSLVKESAVNHVNDEEKVTENELEETKKSGNSEELNRAESKMESAKASSSSSVASSKSSTSSSSSSGSSSPAPKKEKKWVVDKAAWTETVKVPVTKYRNTWWIHFRDGSKKTYYDKQEWIRAYKGNLNAGSWGNGEKEAYTVYETKTINHPEKGHWE